LQKQHTLKVRTTLIHTFPSKSEYNHIILQVNLHAFHVKFPYRPMRSTKNRPAIDRSIAIDALDMPDIKEVRVYVVGCKIIWEKELALLFPTTDLIENTQ
jgi:hypothetical protein